MCLINDAEKGTLDLDIGNSLLSKSSVVHVSLFRGPKTCPARIHSSRLAAITSKVSKPNQKARVEFWLPNLPANYNPHWRLGRYLSRLLWNIRKAVRIYDPSVKSTFLLRLALSMHTYFCEKAEADRNGRTTMTHCRQFVEESSREQHLVWNVCH